MNVAELIDHIRQPGRVMMPVLMTDGVAHIAATKSDLIAYLGGMSPIAKAPWAQIGNTSEDGTRYYDVNDA